MLIVMRAHESPDRIEKTREQIHAAGFVTQILSGDGQVIISAEGDLSRQSNWESFITLPGVERVIPVATPYKLASREFHPKDTCFQLDGAQVGGGQDVVIIAGPCAVESREQILETARAVRAAGAHLLRGGAFKPRSSPYAFQGLGEEGLRLLAEAREATGLPVVTEALSVDQVPVVARYADVIQIGARSMQNYPLLRAVAACGKPVMLKRGMSASIEEFLLAAEYLLVGGNPRVLLCERGIRTFETATRNTVDINAVPVLKAATHLPVLVDPSHGTGHWSLVGAVARAAVAAGADGIMMEVHPNPSQALSDGTQSLKPERFAEVVAELRAIAAAVHRRVPAFA